ncbi:conserved hypothetical protein [Ricinus communis]|uniref:Uncharacterized protein n=1 Tax=Ricinus communis TaxID=3988 RepID=B9TKM5_RICCO|nr:conserved hypothetical protein [Ricinus communis]
MDGTKRTAPVVETGAVSSERVINTMRRWRFAWRRSPRLIAAADLLAVGCAKPQQPVAKQLLDLGGRFVAHFGQGRRTGHDLWRHARCLCMFVAPVHRNSSMACCSSSSGR